MSTALTAENDTTKTDDGATNQQAQPTDESSPLCPDDPLDKEMEKV